MRPVRDRGECFAADIPGALAEADNTLQRYGKWATTSGRGGSCAHTLERQYIREADKKESLEAYLRRRSFVPAEPMMNGRDALRAQRALARVPDRERIVLTILYVPQRLPIHAQLRIMRIPPSLCRGRHLVGLRMFWNLHGLLASDLAVGVQ